MADHHPVAGDLLIGHSEIGAAVQDEHIELFKSSLVHQHFNTLARRQFTLVVLGLDAVIAAAQTRLRTAIF